MSHIAALSDIFLHYDEHSHCILSSVNPNIHRHPFVNRFKIQELYCHVQNSYTEAVVGNEILKFQAPSSNAQNMYKVWSWR